MRVVLKNFHVVDEETDMTGTVIIEDGIIAGVLPGPAEERKEEAALVIDGGRLLSKGGVSRSAEDYPVLMPAFVDLHAHLRDPGFSEKEVSLPAEMLLPSEVLESGSLAAAAGGFGTVVCMANTKPPIDSLEKVRALKKRSDVLGLIDLYPVMSLTRGMEGRELSEIRSLPAFSEAPLMLSEDGKDLADNALFLAAMREAKRLGIPVSCHCDFGGDEAEAAKKAGQPRGVWSRIEENNAVRRVIELGKQAGCHIHIAHVSTKEAVEMIRRARAENYNDSPGGGFTLTCEAMPHNLCLTDEDARRLGDETWGRVNPPLRSEEDRKALVRAVADGTIDAIATDHAPHSGAAKEKGAPGFSGFETAFAAVFTELVRGSGTYDPAPLNAIDLKRLSSLMSARPARLLGFNDCKIDDCKIDDCKTDGARKRGRMLRGYRADLVIVDTKESWVVESGTFKTRGGNSPFVGRELFGKILMTIRGGRIVFER